MFKKQLSDSNRTDDFEDSENIIYKTIYSTNHLLQVTELK